MRGVGSKRKAVWIGWLVTATLGMSACGSSDSGSSSTGSAAAGGDGSDAPAELTAFTKGDFKLPTESSAGAKGKKVVVISCGQQVISCSETAKDAVEAGNSLGWDMSLIDGKFSPPKFAAAIETAVASNADGIMLIAIDCALVAPQLAKAKKAGIAVGAMFAIDCDNEAVGRESMFDAPVVANGSRAWEEQAAQYAIDRAKALVAMTDGKAQVIDFNLDSLPITKVLREASQGELAKCSGCKLVDTIPVTLADLGPALQKKTQTALLQHPEATVVFPPTDTLTLAGVAAGLKASGRSDDVLLFGAEGFGPNIDLIRSNGGQDVAMGFPGGWAAYAVIDGLNRKFNDLEPQDSGLGWQLVDVENNLPTEGPWEPPVDYKSAYKKLWGVS